MRRLAHHSAYSFEETDADRDAAGPNEPDGTTPTPFAPARFEPFDPGTIAPRPYALGNSVLRGSPTGLSAPGGHNKTSLIVQRALAVVTGEPITGERVWDTGVAWYINLEEDADEVRRRIAACCLEFGIAQERLRDRLLIGLGDVPAIVLAQLEDGNAVATVDVQRVIATALQHRVIYLGIDPLVQFHRVSENANEQMAVVVRQLGVIAEQSRAAIDFAAHSRKGATAGDPDSARGASAIRDGVRKLSTLAAMTEEEAEAYGIRADERRRYIRLDDAKANYGPPDAPVRWFRRIGVSLGNAVGDRPADEIGVLRSVDLTERAAARAAEKAREEEPERQSLAQALSDAMPGDRCLVRDLLAVAMDHGRPCKPRAAHLRIAETVPMHPAFRLVKRAGKPHRLFLVRTDPDHPKSPLEACRCPHPE